MSDGESAGMDLRNRQGSYGEQLVAALAASNGLMSTKRSIDYDGIDLEIGQPGIHGTRKHPAIGVQVKTWIRPKLIGTEWHYPLRVKNFNDLAGKNYDYPRFLFLVVLPQDPDKWVTVDHDSLRFARAVYWHCLHDQDCSDQDPKSTVTIKVQRANLVDNGALLGLFADYYRKKLTYD